MGTVTATNARATLPELLDRVLTGEEVTITRHGQPVAVVVRPDALLPRRASGALAGAVRVREMLAVGGRESRPTAQGLSSKRADALVAEMRAGRDVT
jgi:antitoxin (DNA-binding transcriptional repressor) of toxin-antitoxin stability system